MKGIIIDEVSPVLVKIMKKLELHVGPTDMDCGWRVKLKTSFLCGLEGQIFGVHKQHVVQPIL